MDESMTPMECRVVEYHVWKTQMRRPVQGAFDFNNESGISAIGSNSDQFIGFKENMSAAKRRDFAERVAAKWQHMNALDLGKALNEYEEDCPDLPGLVTHPVKTGDGTNKGRAG